MGPPAGPAPEGPLSRRRRTRQPLGDPVPKIISTRLGHAIDDTHTADIPELDRAAAEQIIGLFQPPHANSE